MPGLRRSSAAGEKAHRPRRTRANEDWVVADEHIADDGAPCQLGSSWDDLGEHPLSLAES
jgi:hypothetical protein